MRASALFFVLAAAVVLSGCATFMAPQTGGKKEEAAVEEGADVSSMRQKKKAGEVVRAIEYALSLEKAVWDAKERMHSREDVLGVFRRGFGKKKAEEITDWVWISAVDREGNRIEMLNPGEPVLAIPDRIEILEHEGGRATAVLTYADNLDGPVVWAGHTVVATLENEDGAWKIYDTRISTQ
ncbi:MAG: hypothetical protein JXQ30_17255 [Spirochaetes bacterium]|nr:hypothetical protein [Spirochaetota bacterium]